MDNLWMLILMCFAMFIGCYIFGSIPLAFNFSEDRLKLLTVFGAGLLVGTALVVIIPEGVHAMYNNPARHDHSVQGTSHSHDLHNPAAAAAIGAAAPEKIGPLPAVSHDKHKLAKAADTSKANSQSSVTATSSTGVLIMESGNGHEHAGESTEVAHQMIGLVLVAGFIFMLLVDQCGGHMHASSLNIDMESGNAEPLPNRHRSSGFTATLGLVVHAAADGIALGAASASAHVHIELIVFVAIMLHKAPAALGLTTFLMHDGLDRKRIRKHLAVFSFAAPVMAMLTYFAINSSTSLATDSNTTGLALLFSGGTFLYVATVHVLPEVTRGSERLTRTQLMANLLGTSLPLVLSLGHSHQH